MYYYSSQMRRPRPRETDNLFKDRLVMWQRQDLNQSPRFLTITLCLSDNKPRQTAHTKHPRSSQPVIGAREKLQQENVVESAGDTGVGGWMLRVSLSQLMTFELRPE